MNQRSTPSAGSATDRAPDRNPYGAATFDSAPCVNSVNPYRANVFQSTLAALVTRESRTLLTSVRLLR
jgi:hypothetical protein